MPILLKKLLTTKIHINILIKVSYYFLVPVAVILNLEVGHEFKKIDNSDFKRSLPSGDQHVRTGRPQILRKPAWVFRPQ